MELHCDDLCPVSMILDPADNMCHLDWVPVICSSHYEHVVIVEAVAVMTV